MQTLNWLESHLGSIENTVHLLNEDYCWDINIIEIQKRLVVKSGDTVIFSCDSHEALEAFFVRYGVIYERIAGTDGIPTKQSHARMVR